MNIYLYKCYEFPWNFRNYICENEYYTNSNLLYLDKNNYITRFADKIYTM